MSGSNAKLNKLVDILHATAIEGGYTVPYLFEFSNIVRLDSPLTYSVPSGLHDALQQLDVVVDKYSRTYASRIPHILKFLKRIDPLENFMALPSFYKLLTDMLSQNDQRQLHTAVTTFVLMANNAVNHPEVPAPLQIKSLLKENLSNAAIATVFFGHLYERMLFIWLNRNINNPRRWEKDDFLFCTDENLIFLSVFEKELPDLLPAYVELGWVQLKVIDGLHDLVTDHVGAKSYWTEAKRLKVSGTE